MDRVRCPGCGEEGREVGETFEVPARKDDKAWARVRMLLEQSTEVLGLYLNKEREAEQVVENERAWAKRDDREQWLQEKQRRIEVLTLRSTTSTDLPPTNEP